MKYSEEEVKDIAKNVKQKMVSEEIMCDIAICVRDNGYNSVVEFRDADTLGMGERFVDGNSDEVEVVRVIDRNMTIALNNKIIERSNEMKAVLENRFYISFGDKGDVKHGLVKLESSGVSVLPRYQDKVGFDFINHVDLLKLQPKVNGGSIAAGMVREMISIYQNEPNKSVPELYKMAAAQVAASKMGQTVSPDELRQKESKEIDRPSFRG